MSDIPLTYLADPDRYVDRGPAYSSCVGGRRFSVAHQTAGTNITGQTSFVATTPTFLIYQAAAARRVVLSNLALSQDGAPAGGTIHIALFIDSANRYSSGGTSITPQGTISDSLLTPGYTFRYNPTASAAGSGTRLLYEWTQPIWLGSVFSVDLGDGVAIGRTGSILVYTWAASVAPTWVLGGFDTMEEG